MKSQWTHPKHPKRVYFGTTAKFSAPKIKGPYLEQVFELITTLRNGRPHVVTFDSWQAAKQAGWVKVK